MTTCKAAASVSQYLADSEVRICPFMDCVTDMDSAVANKEGENMSGNLLLEYCVVDVLKAVLSSELS